MSDLKTKRIHVKVTEREKTLFSEIALISGFEKNDGSGDESKLLRYWINRTAKEMGLISELDEVSADYFQEFDDLNDIAIDLNIPQKIRNEVRNFKVYMRGLVSELTPELQETFYKNGNIAFMAAWNICGLDDEDEPTNEEEFGVLLKTIIEEHIQFLEVMGFDMKSALS